MDILTYIVRTRALRIFNLITEPLNVAFADGSGLLALSYTGSIYINGDNYVVEARYAYPDNVSDDEGGILDDLASRAVLPKGLKITQVRRGSESGYDGTITDQRFVFQTVSKPFGNIEHHITTFDDDADAIEFQMRHGGELREIGLTAVPTGCDPAQSLTESTT